MKNVTLEIGWTLCLAVGLVVLLGEAVPLRAEAFRDNFTNPDPTNPDREPVTWFQPTGDRLTIEDGYLLVGNSMGGVGDAAVDNFTPHDVAIQAQFNVLEGDVAGLGLRYDPLIGLVA